MKAVVAFALVTISVSALQFGPGPVASAATTCPSATTIDDIMAAAQLPSLSRDVDELRDGPTERELDRLAKRAAQMPLAVACHARALSTQLRGGDVEAPVLGYLRFVELSSRDLTFTHLLPPDPLTTSVLDAYRAHGLTATASQTLRLRSDAAALPSSVQRAAATLVYGILDAKIQADLAFSQLSTTERAQVMALVDDYYAAEAAHADDPHRAAFMDEPVVAQLGALADQVDYVALAASMQTLAAAVDAAKPLLLTPLTATGFEFLDPLGLVEIRGHADHVFAAPRILALDYGGQETYFGPVGTATPAADEGGFPVALAIDLAGNDVYNATTGAQGMANMGVALLYDGAGDDVYGAADEAQGHAFMGAAMLMDEGGTDRYTLTTHGQGSSVEGLAFFVDRGVANDDYHAHAFAQGVGAADQGQRPMTGTLFLDEGGHDRYRVNSAGQSQGASATMVFVDRSGDDDYFANAGAAQARQCGGIALFLDEGGTDTHYGQRNSQALSTCLGGLSGLFAFGPESDAYTIEIWGQGTVDSGGTSVFYEEGGNERYVATTRAQGSAEGAASQAAFYEAAGDDAYVSLDKSQGYAQSSAQAILYEADGSDSYQATEFAQGSGQFPGSASGGLLLERAGHDRYAATTNVQGAGRNGGSGALVDYAGDDAYSATARAQGFGDASGPTVPAGPGLFVDANGLDTYTATAARNEATWTQGTLGVGWDLTVPGVSVG